MLFTSSSNINATWEYDGFDWSKRTSLHMPYGQYPSEMVYDPARGRCVLLQTEGIGSTPIAAHEWDGYDWEPRSAGVAPGAGDNFTCTFERANGTVLLFGGSAQGGTWRYGPAVPAYVTAFGGGCGGTSGVPGLGLDSKTLPYLGNSVSLRVVRLPPTSPTSMLWGLSNSSYFGQFPLPFDLSVIGMAGCSLLVRDDLSIGLVNSGGTATWGQSVCECPELIGAKFYNQVVTLDPTANPLGFSVSNGTESFIAGK